MTDSNNIAQFHELKRQRIKQQIRNLPPPKGRDTFAVLARVAYRAVRVDQLGDIGGGDKADMIGVADRLKLLGEMFAVGAERLRGICR
jgi:hypothetical protein